MHPGVRFIVIVVQFSFYSQTAEPSQIGSEASLRPCMVASVTQLPLHDLDKQNAAETALLTAYCCYIA